MGEEGGGERVDGVARLLLVPETRTVRLTEHWHVVLDGDEAAKELHLRHYSCRHYRDGREPKLFVGPGEKLVLLTTDADALFVWRRFIDGWLGAMSVWCAIFRNESQVRSSDLIREAERAAQCRWPGEAMYTHVAPDNVKSPNPGYCFQAAGWRRCGHTKGGLIVFMKAGWSAD